MKIRGLRLMLCLFLLPALLSGCELLLAQSALMHPPSTDDEFPMPSEPFPMPSDQAHYTTGSATIVMTQDGSTQTINLDQLIPGARLDSMMGGATAGWRNADGWSVNVMAFGGPDGAPDFAGNQLYFQRVNGGMVWSTIDFEDTSPCQVTVSEMSSATLRGMATCKGVRWTDMLASMNGMGEPTYIEGQSPFEAEVTFEAR